MDANKKWMSTGKIGCTFAALFAKRPEMVGWKTIEDARGMSLYPAFDHDTLLLSMQFPDWNKERVLQWALGNGFYLEEIGEGCAGLRYKIKGDIAWVQYFGPDSHVKTRQAPIPELMMCVKRPIGSYFKVGYNGILHLAHASVRHLSKSKSDKLWETSHINTAKQLGHKPFLPEAAKTTYHA